MKYFFAIFFAIVSTISHATAQEFITQQECIEIALRVSATLETDLASVNAKGVAVRSAKRGAMPSLSAAASASYSIGNPLGSIPGARDLGYSTQLKLEQVIYGGNSVNSTVQAARTEQKIAEYTAINTLQNIHYTAIQYYATLMSTFQQLGVQNQYLLIVEKLYEVIKTRFEEGYISRTDLLMVETRLNDAQMQRITAQQSYLLAQQQLNKLFRNTEFVDYTPQDTLSLPTDLPESVQLNQALQNRADYQVAITGVEYQENLRKVTRSAYNPKLSASITGNYGTPLLNITGIENPLYATAMLSFTAQIFNFGKKQLETQKIRWQKYAAEVSAKQTAQNIAADIYAAEIKLFNSHAKCALNHQNQKVATQNLELSTFSYNEGKLAVLDVLQAQLAWITAYTNSVSAMYEYAVAVASYNLAVGNY